MLVSFDVTDEDKGVIVLDLLHSRLGGQGVLNDVVGIHAVPAGGGLAGVLGSPGGPEGLWPVELHTGSDLQSKEFKIPNQDINPSYLLDPGAVNSLHHLLLHLSGFLNCCHGCLRVDILKFRLDMGKASGRSSGARRPLSFLV